MSDNQAFTDYLHREVELERSYKFADSEQIALGTLIELLNDIPSVWGSNKEAVTVSFDFGTAYPSGLASWRGSYSELAIGYELSGYDISDGQFSHKDLSEFVTELKGAVGKEYTGWKGGEYRMTINTPLWVANDGNAGNTQVIGIKNNDYEVIILTQYGEY